MAGKMLRVLARGTACAPVHSAQSGSPRFVGRVNDYELGTPYTVVDESGIQTPGIMPARVCLAEPTVFVQSDDPGEFNEQITHLRDGVLWPFDEATARMAGVPFDPTYGGEYVKDGGKLVNVAHRDALAELAKAAAPAAPIAPKPALVTLSTQESK